MGWGLVACQKLGNEAHQSDTGFLGKSAEGGAPALNDSKSKRHPQGSFIAFGTFLALLGHLLASMDHSDRHTYTHIYPGQ